MIPAYDNFHGIVRLVIARHSTSKESIIYTVGDAAPQELQTYDGGIGRAFHR